MKKLLLFIFLFSIYKAKAQQNLVLNPSFEDLNGTIFCGYYGGNLLPFTNWTSASYGSVDPLSLSLSISCLNHPLNPISADQLPHTGQNYIGLGNAFYNPNSLYDFREYLRGGLSQPLQVGFSYRIEFYVCVGKGGNHISNNLGLRFINSSYPIQQTNEIIDLEPHVNYSGPPISDDINWTLLSFIYTPTENNLNEFIIGNFFNYQDTNFQMVNNLNFNGMNLSYTLIDDVAVYLVQPEFDISNEICQGSELTLPTESINGYSGSWSPLPNNQETTTYTFTPDIDGLPTFEITINVNPSEVPEFNEVGPFCDEVPNISALPTISNNGIEGTWSPAFNSTQTETYTFTPNEDFCAEVVTMKVILDKTPTFDEIEPFCDIDLNFSLPTVSTNGISGTWAPAFDPYNSQTYTFTRDFGDCTQQVTLDVVINSQLNFTLSSYCNEGEYFVDIITNNFSISEIKDVKWTINNTLASEIGSKLNLSDYSNLLQEVNTLEVIFSDSNGCLHTKEIQVLGEYLCKIQKGISPNGDGLNEYFDLVSFRGVDLKIFNRYGSIVYEKSNYTNEWIGQSNSGKKLPTGTYFYQIQTNIGEQFTGYIQLNN